MMPCNNIHICQASTLLSSPNYSEAPSKSYPRQESVDASCRKEAEAYEQQEQSSMAREETIYLVEKRRIQRELTSVSAHRLLVPM